MDTGKKDPHTRTRLLRENEELRRRLEEAERTLEAIRQGDVHALAVTGPRGEQIYTLTGAERTYRAIVETINEVALTVDPEGTILFCNQRFCDLMRTPMNEVLGRAVAAFAAPPQQAPLNALLRDARARPVQRRITLRAADGTPVPVLFSASPLQTADNHSICLVASDLTESEESAYAISVLRQQQQSLEASEERYRRFFMDDLTGDFIAMPEGKLIECNPAFAEIYGFASPAQATRCSMAEFTPDDWPDLVERVQEQGTIRGHEAWHRRPDGRRIYVVANLVGQFDDAGKLIGVKGYLFDDTPRKAAEDALEAANDRLRGQSEDLAVANEQLLTQREELLRQTVELELMRQGAERTAEEMEWLARISEENPDPVLRISTTGVVLYRNAAATSLCRRWSTGDEMKIPPAIHEMVQTAYADTAAITREETCGQRTWLLTAAPAPTLDYVNIFARDITARKQAEEILKIKDDAITSSLNAIAMADLEGRLTYVNPAFLKLWGYEDKREVLGRSVLDFWEAPEQAVEIMRAIGNGQGWTGELTAVRKDGTCLSLNLSASTVFNDAGAPLCMIASFVDISDRKQAEEALRRSEERLRLAQQVAHVGTFEWNIRTGVNQWTAELEAIYGLPPGGFAGTQEAWEQLVHPEDRDEAVRRVARAFETGAPVEGEWRVVWPDGSVHWLAGRWQVFKDESGDPVRMTGINIDITERKRAEEALRESEQRLKLAQKAAHIGVFDWNMVTDESVWTEEFCTIFGLDPDDSQRPAEAWQHVVPPEDRARVEREFYAAAAERQPEFVTEYRILRPGGAIGWVVNRTAIRYDEAGRPVRMIGIAVDITARKQAEEALRESRKDLNRAQAVAHTGSWRLDTRRNVLLWSDETYRIFGLPLGTPMTYETFLATVHPDDRSYVDQRWTACLRGEPYDIEHRIIVGDTIKWVRERAELEFDDAGALLGGFGTVQDITERKRAEETLRMSEEKFRTLHAMSPIAIVLNRLDNGQFLESNQALWDMTGYTEEEFRSLTYWDITPAEYQDMEAKQLELLHTVGRYGPYEKEYIRKDGTRFPVLLSGVRIKDPGGTNLIYSVIQDITELKEKENALRGAKEYAESLIETANVMVVGLDEHGRVCVFNEAAEQITGYSREELLGKHWFDVLVPEQRYPWVWEEFNRLRAGGLPRTFENPILTKSGAERIISWQNSTMREDGRVTGTISFGIDITERKRSESALRESEERFHRLFEDDLTGNFLATPAGEILLCNPAFAQIFGFASTEDVVGTNMLDLYPDVREREPLLERLRQQGKIERLEVWRQRRDGKSIYVVENLVGHFNERGELYEIKGYIFDDTERKRAEEALRESEQRHRRLLENLKGSHFVYVHDTQGVFEYLSESLTGVLGYTPEEFMTHYSKYMTDHPVNQAVHRHTELSTQGVRQPPYEVNMWHKDRSTRWLEVQEVPVLDAAGRVVAVEGVAQDITERKQAEEALRELNATLESKVAQRTAELQDRARQLQRLTLELTLAEDRERRRLAEILHDDLQQQIAGAKFHLSLMTNRTRDDDTLHRTATRVDEMLADAIEKSRSLSHELAPALLYQSDLGDTLHWLGEQMRAKHGLIARVEADGRVDSSSDALKTFLFRTAQEMLFNVVKHARTLEARVRVRRMAGCLCLSVSDRGRGFDPQEVKATTGFGLLSIRERVQLLGGRMKIRSVPGRGSTFFLAVPDGGTTEDAGAGPRARPAQGNHGEARLRVLIVDDHRIVRQSLAALLGDELDLEVVGEAANGREAVNEAHRLRPDVIVMDVLMPLMGGDEATRQIKAALPETRVVALSMFHEPKAARRMHEAGAESYILKTDPSDELLAAVRGAPAPPPGDDDTSASMPEPENS